MSTVSRYYDDTFEPYMLTFMNQGNEFRITQWIGQVMQPAQHIPTNSDKVTYAMRTRLLETPLSFYNSRTKHDLKMKLTSVDFSRQGAEGSRSSWLQTLSDQLINRSPFIRYMENDICCMNFKKLLLSLKWT